jgi:hypothetical protein
MPGIILTAATLTKKLDEYLYGAAFTVCHTEAGIFATKYVSEEEQESFIDYFRTIGKTFGVDVNVKFENMELESRRRQEEFLSQGSLYDFK